MLDFSIVHKGGWMLFSSAIAEQENVSEINKEIDNFLDSRDEFVSLKKDFVLIGKDMSKETREKLLDSFVALYESKTSFNFHQEIPKLLQESKTIQNNYKKKEKLQKIVKNDLDYSEPQESHKKLQLNMANKELILTPDKEIKENNILAMFSILNSKKITQKDLYPLLEQFKNHLISKNVANEIAQDIVDSVSKEVSGQLQSRIFDSIDSKLRNSLHDILSRILTPKTCIDLLSDIKKINKSFKRPFSMVFVGVNGVGKSTNLSKVCFWLLQNKFKVLIAACDTFRSGAVEQLGVHVRNLKDLDSNTKVELYNRGYGKDPANIAKEAIQYGKNNGFDVVLIDTAGRMQNNEPLMRALSKLVSLNNPDRILFVGEALVGNEAIDQLSKFNRALVDFSGKAEPRKIDGIILSKFDTIDDKVGAAISMTYTTGQPIYFVGTGQTYTDLRKLNVKSVVNSLLSK